MTSLRSALVILSTIVVLSGGAVATGCGSDLEQVRLQSGPVTGAREEVQERQIWSFKGIPYAAPPVGELSLEAASAGGVMDRAPGLHLLRTLLSAAGPDGDVLSDRGRPPTRTASI